MTLVSSLFTAKTDLKTIKFSQAMRWKVGWADPTLRAQHIENNRFNLAYPYLTTNPLLLSSFTNFPNSLSTNPSISFLTPAKCS